MKIEKIYDYYLSKYNVFLDIIINNENMADKRHSYEKIKYHSDICFAIIGLIFNREPDIKSNIMDIKKFFKSLIYKINKVFMENKINLIYDDNDNACFLIPEKFYENYFLYVLSVYSMKFVEKQIIIELNTMPDSEFSSILKIDIIIQNNNDSKILYSVWLESGCEEIAKLNKIKSEISSTGNKLTIYFPLINITKKELLSNNFSEISSPEIKHNIISASSHITSENNSTLCQIHNKSNTITETVSVNSSIFQIPELNVTLQPELNEATHNKIIIKKAFDYEKLYVRCNEDNTKVSEVVNVFTRSFFNYFYKLNMLLYENDIKKFTINVKALKKLAEDCNADTIVSDLEEMENIIYAGKANKISKILENLNIEFEVFGKELNKHGLDI